MALSNNAVAPYDATALAAFINEVWSTIVLEPKFEGLTVINFVRDLSEFMSEGGDICHVPSIFTNLFAVSTQTTQTNAITDQSPDSIDTTLTIATHKYVAWIIGDRDMRQMASKYSLNERYVSEASRLLLQTIEDALFGLYTSIITNTTGDVAGVITDLHVRTAIQKLQSSNGQTFSTSEMAFFVDPASYWLQLAAIQKYYDKSINGRDSIVQAGNFGSMGNASSSWGGTLYNVPVYITPRVVKVVNVAKNLLLTRDALGFAVQNLGANRVRTQVQYWLPNLATLAVVDILFGVGVLREPASVLVNSLTTSTTA